MSVTYPGDCTKANKARKVGRKFAPNAASKIPEVPCDTSDSSRARENLVTAEQPVRRTPDPSEDLFSMPQFSVDDVDQVRKLMHESLTSLAVEIGTQVACSLLEEDVVKLCGAKSERVLKRANSRHGSQPGYVILGGQKVAVRRPRVRSIDGQEVSLEVYESLQAEGAMPAAALAKMVRGVSCRDYADVVDTARAGFGVKKSSVSRNFVEATRAQVEAFAERRFDETTFAAVFVDGIAFSGEMLVVALGISEDGSKRVMGLVRGETENTEIVTSLLTNLRGRGLKTSQPTLFCLDGSKALASAVKKVFGDKAVIQRCQVHKTHNVESHVASKHRPDVRRRMNEAYAQVHHADAKRLLLDTVAWLRTVNPDAAASLEEGLEETITVIRLGLEGELKRFFATTNAIESMFGRVREVTRRVKRYRDGDMRHRWCVTGLLRAEQGFRRIRGYKEMTKLIDALRNDVLDKQTHTR
jgi:transposase-like protein